MLLPAGTAGTGERGEISRRGELTLPTWLYHQSLGLHRSRKGLSHRAPRKCRCRSTSSPRCTSQKPPPHLELKFPMFSYTRGAKTRPALGAAPRELPFSTKTVTGAIKFSQLSPWPSMLNSSDTTVSKPEHIEKLSHQQRPQYKEGGEEGKGYLVRELEMTDCLEAGQLSGLLYNQISCRVCSRTHQ